MLSHASPLESSWKVTTEQIIFTGQIPKTMPVLQVLVAQQDIARFRTLGHQLPSQRTLVACCQEAKVCAPFACAQ